MREVKPVTTRRVVFQSLFCCLGFGFVVYGDGTLLTVWGLNFVVMAIATAQAERAYRIQRRLMTPPKLSESGSPG